MKQSISKEQWEELEGSLQSKFIWPTFTGQTVCVGRPTIGELIQFLGDEWLVYIDEAKIDGDYNKTEFVDSYELQKPENILNSLWEACVYKLRQ